MTEKKQKSRNTQAKAFVVTKKGDEYEEYNSNIVTMLMWNHYYEIYYKLFDHYALILKKFNFRTHQEAYEQAAYDLLMKITTDSNGKI